MLEMEEVKEQEGRDIFEIHLRDFPLLTQRYRLNLFSDSYLRQLMAGIDFLKRNTQNLNNELLLFSRSNMFDIVLSIFLLFVSHVAPMLAAQYTTDWVTLAAISNPNLVE